MFKPLYFCNWACDVTIDRLICDKDLMTVNLAHRWIQKKIKLSKKIKIKTKTYKASTSN